MGGSVLSLNTCAHLLFQGIWNAIVWIGNESKSVLSFLQNKIVMIWFPPFSLDMQQFNVDINVLFVFGQ